MPIYEYKCNECGAEREVILPLSESSKQVNCACGREMRKVPSLALSIFPTTGKGKVLRVLNQERGYDFPGGDKHRKRYEQSFSAGLDPPKQTIGVGF